MPTEPGEYGGFDLTGGSGKVRLGILMDVYEEKFDGGYKVVDISESLDFLIDGLEHGFLTLDHP